MLGTTLLFLAALPGADPAPAKVSYDRQVRPIFRAQCQGCHQPAKNGGGYDMTAPDRLRAGGDSGEPAVVPGKPEKSALFAWIAGTDGHSRMPKGKPPLPDADVKVIRAWVEQGAADDSPADARPKYGPARPPVYSRQPVVAALDFSPDGQLLAVAAFHEVLLFKGDGSERVARLVGLAERVESVRFSPDGKLLAASGGLPGRAGEVQVWDVARRKLKLSVPVTADTATGLSWSPDGKKLAFGCSDNSVRAIDASTGEQVLFQGAHGDWALGTAFTPDGSHLVSVGRDRTAKLTEVATQRFVDNITSITPGALKGGIGAVASHPKREEIIVGGADGRPKVYRVHRATARVIGDDSNLVRELPDVRGRVNAVAVSPDGKWIAAAGGLDGAGEVSVYPYAFDATLPEEVRAASSKQVSQRSAEEKAAIEAYHKAGVTRAAKVEVPHGVVYALAFRPDGKVLAAAGAGGAVRLIEPQTGKTVKEFAPAPLDAAAAAAAPRGAARPEEPVKPDAAGPSAVRLEVRPEKIAFTGRYDYAQLLVTGVTPSGERFDATRSVEASLDAAVADLSKAGLVTPRADGEAVLRLTAAGQSVAVPVSVRGLKAAAPVSFVRDVQPVLSRLGCNQGTCHGSAQGKNGFKLSLRGYDPLYDHRALTDELASRRVNLASPDDSLMLLKASGAVPHVGGQLTKPGEAAYELVRAWVAGGARLDLDAPRVTRIDIAPTDPVVQKVGGRQQLRVVATYADKSTRDVTREAFLESGNTEVATADRLGVLTAVRRGEAPVLARYEGAYAATTLTVMGDRDGFAWEEPPANNRIDELVAAKWKRMKIRPSGLCTDAEFVRRVYLDLTGLPPTAAAVRKFLDDSRPTRVKRDELIDKLVGSDEYVDHWTNKWSDLLQVNRKFLGAEGAAAFRRWVRKEVAANTPYDQFARKVLTATGSNWENPPASYFKITRKPAETMENTTHLFLAVRFNCNKCHDHPFEKWTQDQYYQTAAFFAQVDLKKDPASGSRTVAGTAVEGATPLFEVVKDTGKGEVTHDRTGAVTAPKFPFDCDHAAPADATRREQLAAWLTAKGNPYFARSYANRVWGYLLGVGLIEPIDDIRAGNPATNPELLDYLTSEFVKSGFDVRKLMRDICRSRAYQLSVETNTWNADDKTNYSHASARRLPAEVLYDAVHRVTGSVSKIPGVPAGTRAAELPDSGVDLPSGFLATLGRPARESACECERSGGLQMGPVMALISGPTVADAVADPKGEVTKLVASQADDAKLADELFLRVLNRPATPAEAAAFRDAVAAVGADHARLTKALADREAAIAPVRARQERERLEAVEGAKKKVAEYEASIAARVAEEERQRVAKAARLETDLRAYETGLLARMPAWEIARDGDPRWAVPPATSLAATGEVTLTRQADGVIAAEGKDKASVYTVTVGSPLKSVTGFRLEVLAGRAKDGGFVLTELEVLAAPKSDPKKAQKLKLRRAAASAEEPGLDVKQLFDNSVVNSGNGWGVLGRGGETHWATFEPEAPVTHDGGTLFTFKFHNARQGHGVGRFRVALADARVPVGLGLSAELAALLDVPAAKRDPALQARLVAHFWRTQPGWGKLTAELAAAREPLPVDPKLKELRQALEAASRPVPEDRELARLRRDADASAKQAGDPRLTAAQDLTWALINSPAFLFNR